MEEEFEINAQQQELIDIIISVVSALQIHNKKSRISFKETIEKIRTFKVEDKNKELKHFVFLVKNLFLGKNESFDFDSSKLINILTKDVVKDIFDSLIEYIKSNSFLDFLLKLGDIFSDTFFKDDNIEKLVEQYKKTGLNNYEVLFHIFSMCKKSKVDKYILENYDIYYSETYSNYISYNLIIANNAYIKLCISSPNFDNLEDFISDEDSSTDNSKDKTTRINEIEDYIYNSLITFWCNSIFWCSDNLQDFMNIFYQFITQDGKKKFILNNKMDKHIKNYLEYLSFHLEKLFKYFNEDSLKEFKNSLYNFVISHQNEKINFVDRALAIGKTKNLSEEDIGFISMICSNHKFIEDMEKLASKYGEEDLEEIEDEQGLLDEESLILEYLISEKERQNTNKIEIFYPPINDNDKSDEDKIDLQKENSQQKIEPKERNNDLDNDPKYQNLVSTINKMKEEHAEEISSLNKKIDDLANKISNMKKENEKETLKLKQDIERLNDIHKKIYFRDVSKFYIRKYAQAYDVAGESTFHICKNIMDSGFPKSIEENLKKVIPKIVAHYLNGNKFAHMEYFISKSKFGIKTKLVIEIENSYAEFMKFNDKEKKELINKFKIINAPFIYHHQFK